MKMRYQIKMLIEHTVQELYVHRKESRLTVAYVEKTKKGWVHGAKLKIFLDTKRNNYNPKKLTAELEVSQQQLKRLYRKFASPILYIHRCHPWLTLLQELSLILRDTTSTFTNKQISTIDFDINYAEKYWALFQGELSLRGGTCTPRINILQRNHLGQVLIATTNIHQLQLQFAGKSITQLQSQIKERKIPYYRSKKMIKKIRQNKEKKKKIKYMRKKIWKELAEQKIFTIDEDFCTLKTSSKIFPAIPITIFTLNKWQYSLSRKEKLFRHIFVTELVAHMIINQFGRKKHKKHKYRDGLTNYQYEDEQLQAMRSCGHRFSEFRDYSVETFHPPEDECEFSEHSSEEGLQGNDEDIAKQENKKKKTFVSAVGNKIKRVLKSRFSSNKQELQNFIIISGKDKSQINKKRYCLHQMTRETDKTQALINFIQLTFSSYWSRKELLSWAGESEYQKKIRLSYFLDNFKVKRTTSCLQEYTRQSFFHKVLNIGLRVLKKPHELTYLRLPFSHMFWSIKQIYQRHKKTIFHQKKEKNQERVIKMYRGSQMSEAEITTIKKNIGGFIQMEGFLSTTLREEINAFFRKNVSIIINVPVMNLKGLHDNGFTHISHFSQHPSEHEVLFNAFNMFRILSLHTKSIKNVEVHEITMEYRGIKQIEEKMGKSQNLLESQFLMKVEQQKIQEVKYLLSMKKEKMTPIMVKKLNEKLAKVQKNLKKWQETLKNQEKKEFISAYQQLSKWEQELLDNSSHLEQIIQHIDNYGELLVSVGEYERATAYCEKMVKQVQRDRAIEDWQWRKTPCLAQKEELYRLLLAQCYNRQCRYRQQAAQLQAIKELYTDMNKHRHHQYSQLLKQLTNTYQYLYDTGYSEEYFQCQTILDSMPSEYTIQNTNQHDSNNSLDIWDEISMLSLEELESRIKEQRKKLEQISIHTLGKHNNHYLYQQYLLILMLYQHSRQKKCQQKRDDYKKVMVESMMYFANRKYGHPQNTILLFNILFQIVEDSGIGRKWLCIVGKQLIQLITTHIYHQQQIYIIWRCMKLCMLYGERMMIEKLLEKVAGSRIQCGISALVYDYLMMIFVYMWSISRQCMLWVKKNQQDGHQLSHQGKKYVHRFPHSIVGWHRKYKVKCFWSTDIIKGFQQLEEYYNKDMSDYQTRRKIEHLSQYIQSYLRFVVLKSYPKRKLEVRVWQQPNSMWNTVYGRYGVSNHVCKGDMVMALLYMHASHPNYLRVLSSVSQLHLPRDTYQQLDTLIQYPRQEGQSERIQKVRKRYHYRVIGHLGKQQYLRKRKTTFIQASQENKDIIKSYMRFPHQLSIQIQLSLLKESLMEGSFYNLQKTKEYCELSVGNCADIDRIVGVWDGEQRGYVRKQLKTMEKLHGRSLPLSEQALQMGGGSSLGRLVEQEMMEQIEKECYLMKKEYLIPGLKVLVYQHSVPMQLMRSLFDKSDKCSQLLSRLLGNQKWIKQLKNAIQCQYPNKHLLQKVKKIQKQLQLSLQQSVSQTFALAQQASETSQFQQLELSSDQSVYQNLSQSQFESERSERLYLQQQLKFNEVYQQFIYDKDDDQDDIGKRQCMRYAVLRILVDKQELHPFLMKLLSPVVRYSQITQKDDQQSKEYEEQYNKMKDGYEALVQTCLESKSFLHDGGWTPRWWDMPTF